MDKEQILRTIVKGLLVKGHMNGMISDGPEFQEDRVRELMSFTPRALLSWTANNAPEIATLTLGHLLLLIELIDKELPKN